MAFVWKRGKFTAVLLFFQVLFIILFAAFVEYDDTANAHAAKNSIDHDRGGADPNANPVSGLYPMFQDVHVMIFVGFGFLMTFLKRYSYSSVGLNMLIAAFVLQWSILFSGFLHMADAHSDGKIHVNLEKLLLADFAAAAVLITFGAVLGKTSPLQLILISFLEIIVFTINEWVGLNFIKVADVGGSMFVHVFGAYFGLAVARVLYKKDVEDSTKEGPSYHSDVFAMIGTVFLWMYWPSFNSALAVGDDQHRAVINTYLALASCCVVSFAISSAINKESKFDMVHIQNSTLAGGVAVGTCADMMIEPYGALLIGTVAGIISVTGYNYITPWLSSKLKIHDTCGVNNLHGMPGVLAGLGGIIAAAVANTHKYGNSLYFTFPARAPVENSTELLEIQKSLSIDAGDGRSAGMQAGMQAAALFMTIGFAIVGGLITGLIIKLSIWDPPTGPNIFDDGVNWETPEDFAYERVENGIQLKKGTLLDGGEARDDDKDVKV